MKDPRVIATYPRHRPKRDRSYRRWHVHYDLAYDGGGGMWTGFYRTVHGAKLSIWWNLHIASWGGTAVLVDSLRAPRPSGEERT